MEAIGARLKAIRHELKKTQSEMARSAGVSLATWQLYEAGKTAPKMSTLEALGVLGFSCDWILLGIGEMRRERGGGMIAEEGRTSYSSAKHLQDDYVLVPRYNVKVSAGGGSFIESEQVVDHLAFKTAWIKGEMRLNPGDLLLVSATGESMYPTIRERDLLLVDKSDEQRQLRDGAVYLLRIDNLLLAKRLEKLLDGSVLVKSDNQQFQTQQVSAERLETLSIIGRVVWMGRRM